MTLIYVSGALCTIIGLVGGAIKATGSRWERREIAEREVEWERERAWTAKLALIAEDEERDQFRPCPVCEEPVRKRSRRRTCSDTCARELVRRDRLEEERLHPERYEIPF